MDKVTEIFLSHAHDDHRIAARLEELLLDVSSQNFRVARSSNAMALQGGENWREWIDDKIVDCDTAIVLLTPGSLRAQWVLWEAGAVAGVRNERMRTVAGGDEGLADRQVRLLRFGLSGVDLGPFGSRQAKDGLNQEAMESFIRGLLTDFEGSLQPGQKDSALVSLKATVEAFIADASEALRYSPIYPSEAIVQDWLDRLDEAESLSDDQWIIAATRWINVAFLGAGGAEAHLKDEAIDFRIHLRIASAHERRREWVEAMRQLELALRLSPNDLVVLRRIGLSARQSSNNERLEKVLEQMEELDASVFQSDREGIALKCGYLADLSNWVGVRRVLTDADDRLLSSDSYMLTWRAIASMKTDGPDAALGHFRQLKDAVGTGSKDFWSRATLVNALLALSETTKAGEVLRDMNLAVLQQAEGDDFESATRYYDDIAVAYSLADAGFDWRAEAGLS